MIRLSTDPNSLHYDPDSPRLYVVTCSGEHVEHCIEAAEQGEFHEVSYMLRPGSRKLGLVRYALPDGSIKKLEGWVARP